MSGISCPYSGDYSLSVARKEYFSSAQNIASPPTRLGLSEWLQQEWITLSREYENLVSCAKKAQDEAWKLHRFLSISTSERPILWDDVCDLALRRWTESRNAAIIEDFLLEYGGDVLEEISSMSSMGIEKEIEDKWGIIAYFSHFWDKNFEDNVFSIALFQNDMVEIMQSIFRSFIVGKLTSEEERIMALFGIQMEESGDTPGDKILKSFLWWIWQLMSDSCRLVGNSIVLYHEKYGKLPLPGEIDTMFRSSFRSQVMESAFWNHSLDQIQRRKNGRREVYISSTDTILRDTSRATADYLASTEHMQKSSQARLRFRCPFVRGKYTSDFLLSFQDSFLTAIHRNYDRFLPDNHELEAFL